MLRFNSHAITAFHALKKLTTGARLRLHRSSKGHVHHRDLTYLEMTFTYFCGISVGLFKQEICLPDIVHLGQWHLLLGTVILLCWILLKKRRN